MTSSLKATKGPSWSTLAKYAALGGFWALAMIAMFHVGKTLAGEGDVDEQVSEMAD